MTFQAVRGFWVFFCVWFSERAAPPVNPDWVKGHRSHLSSPSHAQPIHVCPWIHRKKSGFVYFLLVASVSHQSDSASVILWFFPLCIGGHSHHLWLSINDWFQDEPVVRGPPLTFLRHRNCVLFTSFVRCEMCAAVTKRLRASCPESHNSSLWKSFGGDQYPSDR